MPLPSTPGGTYFECGFLLRAGSLRPALTCRRPLLSVCPGRTVDDSPTLSVVLRFGPVKQLILEKGLLMRRLWKTLGSSVAVWLVVTLGAQSRCGLESLAFAAPGASGDPPAASPLGFTPGSREGQLKAEALAVAVPTPENARSWLRTLTAEPHVAGTPADYKTAVFVRDKLREWGWKAELEELEVLLNYPREGSPPALKITRPIIRSCRLTRSPWRLTRIRRAAAHLVRSMAMGSQARKRDRSST